MDLSHSKPDGAYTNRWQVYLADNSKGKLMKRFRIEIAETGEAILIVEADNELAAFERTGLISGRAGPDVAFLRSVWNIKEHQGPVNVHFFSDRFFELNLHLEQAVAEEEHM
jgi:hypothetical protein